MSLMENKGKSSELTNSVFLLDLSSSPVDFASQADLHISDHLQSPRFVCLDSSCCRRTLVSTLVNSSLFSKMCRSERNGSEVMFLLYLRPFKISSSLRIKTKQLKKAFPE